MTRQRPTQPHPQTTERPAHSVADAEAEVLADPTRVQQLDPRRLLVDTNIRHDTRIDRALVASIRDHGVLETIQAVATGDGRARVRFGHRRTLAAIAADRATVPVVVHPVDETDPIVADAGRLAAQYAENTHRTGLSTAEQLDVFAGLADLGLTAGQIASQTKARRPDVVAALRAAQSTDAREAVASANLTLAQGAALADFADDPEAYRALLDRAAHPGRWGGSFEHLAQRLRDDRADRAELARVLAEFTEAGVPVLDEPWDLTSPVTRLSDLTDDPQAPVDAHGTTAPSTDAHVGSRSDLDGARSRAVANGPGSATGANGPEDDEEPEVADGEYDGDLRPADADAEVVWRDDGRNRIAPRGGGDRGPAPISPAAHARCPGHAAHVAPAHGPIRVEAVFVCTDPARYGHRPRYDYMRLLGGENTESDAGPGARTDDRGAQRRRVIAGNRAWRSAGTVRREFVAALLARRTPPKGAGAYLATALSTDWHALNASAGKGHDLAADLLTGRPGALTDSARDRVAAHADGVTDARGHVVALAVVLGGIEAGLGVQSWRRDPHRGVPGTLVRYLRFLASCGYEPAPVERYALGEDVDDVDVFGPLAPRDDGTPAGTPVEDTDGTD